MGVKHEIIIADKAGDSYDQSRIRFVDIDYWAQQNCPSYTGYQVEDVSDVSPSHDLFGVYCFNDEKDVVWFKLKWL
jgi:hypothetical protein